MESPSDCGTVLCMSSCMEEKACRRHAACAFRVAPGRTDDPSGSRNTMGSIRLFVR